MSGSVWSAVFQPWHRPTIVFVSYQWGAVFEVQSVSLDIGLQLFLYHINERQCSSAVFQPWNRPTIVFCIISMSDSVWSAVFQPWHRPTTVFVSYQWAAVLEVQSFSLDIGLQLFFVSYQWATVLEVQSFSLDIGLQLFLYHINERQCLKCSLSALT